MVIIMCIDDSDIVRGVVRRHHNVIENLLIAFRQLWCYNLHDRVVSLVADKQRERFLRIFTNQYDPAITNIEEFHNRML